jgi:DNA-binding NarL/FixJ family response regulator
MSKIRIVAVERQALLLRDSEPSHLHHAHAGTVELVGAAGDALQLVEMSLRLRPDTVILDDSIPNVRALLAAMQINKAIPAVRLIFVGMQPDQAYVREGIDAGTATFIPRVSTGAELAAAIDRAMAGKRDALPESRPRSLFPPEEVKTGQPELLTERQKQILELICRGHLSKQIAHMLDISIKTVEFHRSRIMARLGAHTIAELVRRALERGLIGSPIYHPNAGSDD